MFIPFSTIQNWVEAGGGKAQQHVAGKYLDAVLAKFSGYIAADELYDGPFCVLSIVDNHTFRRITYEVLDHDPTHVDIERFFRTFRAALDQRGLTLREIMDEVYRLFDRRCRTDTALEKLARLRRRVRRFKKIGKTLQKLFSP